MRAAKLILVYRLAVVVAILASAILVIEYQVSGVPTFCGPTSGCAKVRASEVGVWITENLGLSLPSISVMLHVALLGGSLFAASKVHLRLIAVASAIGGVVASVLILLQFVVIDAVCAYCMAIDLSAIVYAVSGVLLAREASRDEPSALRFSADAGVSMLAVWCIAGGAAVSLPFLWAKYPVEPPLPAAIASLSVPGKLTVVMATDFECPFCRKLSPVLHEALERAGESAAHVRIMAPLDFHAGALSAAKAYVCAPDEERDAVAEALYAADPTELTRAGALRIGETLGLDAAGLATCFDNPKTEARVLAEKESYKSLGAKGLPLTYIGATAVLGFDPEGIQSAMERGLRGGSFELPLFALFALMAFLGAGAAFVTLRAAKPE